MLNEIHMVRVVFVRLLVLALLASLMACATPKAALQEASSVDTIEAYKEMVRRFPRSASASTARRRIAVLRLQGALTHSDKAELVQLAKDRFVSADIRKQAQAAVDQMDLDSLVAKRDVTALKTYIKKNPRGQLLPKARQALDDLVFEHAKQTASAAALRGYLKKQPRGRHVQEANSLIEQLEFSVCEKKDSYVTWQLFLKLHPNGAHAETAKQRVVEIETQLIEALMVDLDVSATDKWGGTRLHEAASTGNILLAKAMIRKGADVNATIARTKITPLHIASLHDHGAVAQYLLENGADPNATDKLDSYPLDFASSNSTTASVLKKAGGSASRIIHIPMLFGPPGGFDQYDRVANMVVMRQANSTMYYINRHGRSPRLSGPTSEPIMFDMYESKWQTDTDGVDPYAP